MAIIETLFDLSYLFLVIFLGIRLLFEGKKSTALYGIMAILLGLGDGFHLLPRVISHLDPAGFDAHVAILSYGRMVTGITMTIFYVLFYFYYREKSGDVCPKKGMVIYILASIRIILILLPGNNWGTSSESFAFAIYRNIPFLIMGLFLVYLTYKAREKTGLKYMSTLIFLSFFFYIPVVFFSKTFPIVGALMMPKTVCYFLIVAEIYKHYIPTFEKRNVLGLSLSFLVTGLLNGVLYREITRFYQVTVETHLGKLHVHTLVLGFILLLLLYLFIKNKENEIVISFKVPLYLYLSSLIFTIVTMALQGFYDVVGGDKTHIKLAILDGISGIGHILLSIGIIWLFAKLYQSEHKENIQQI